EPPAPRASIKPTHAGEPPPTTVQLTGRSRDGRRNLRGMTRGVNWTASRLDQTTFVNDRRSTPPRGPPVRGARARPRSAASPSPLRRPYRAHGDFRARVDQDGGARSLNGLDQPPGDVQSGGHGVGVADGQEPVRGGEDPLVAHDAAAG